MTFYSKRDFSDKLSQRVALSGRFAYDDWLFSVGQSYATSSDPLIETGTQTDQETFSTSLSASHPFGTKWMLQLTANQTFHSAESFNSTRRWSSMEWLNYQFDSRMSAGVGVGGGYDDVSSGVAMWNESVMGRFDVRIAEKLNVAVNGGGSFRQFVGIDETLISPVYGASIQYRPFEQTTLTLSGNKAVSPSLLRGLVNESTDISIAVGQRLLGIFYLTVSGGYGTVDYLLSIRGLNLSRSDETRNFSVRLNYPFWERASLSAFYRRAENTSSIRDFTFGSTQTGLNFGYHF